MRLAHLPARVASGLYILNSGLSKRNAPQEVAAGLHGFATTAYPFLEQVPPAKFVKALSTSEIVLGSALLVPFVPTRLVALALGAFSAGLLGLYLRVPGMREAGSLRWTEQGQAIAKDVFLAGIAGTLLADGGTRRDRSCPLGATSEPPEQLLGRCPPGRSRRADRRGLPEDRSTR